MIVYLAGPYSRRAEFVGYATQLADLGHSVTSTWLTCETQTVADDGVTLAGHPGALAMLARMDLRDLDESELVIVFTEPATVPVRGGYLVEMGYALGRKKRVVVVGQMRTLFDWAIAVRVFATWEECREWLRRDTKWERRNHAKPVNR